MDISESQSNNKESNSKSCPECNSTNTRITMSHVRDIYHTGIITIWCFNCKAKTGELLV
jgi:C4-type Zn-finger protein